MWRGSELSTAVLGPHRPNSHHGCSNPLESEAIGLFGVTRADRRLSPGEISDGISSAYALQFGWDYNSRGRTIRVPREGIEARPCT